MNCQLSKIIFSLFALLIIANSSYSQIATKQYIDSLLIKYDSTYLVDSDNLFIVNGVQVDSKVLDSVVSQFQVQYLMVALYFSKSNYFYPINRSIVALQFAIDQKRSIKRRRWRMAKRKIFKSPELKFDLLVDNNLLYPALAKQIFREISFSDILYIDIKNEDNCSTIKIWKKH